MSSKADSAFEGYATASTVLLSHLVAKQELVRKKAVKAFFKAKDAELEHYRAIVRDTVQIDVCRLRLFEAAIVALPLRKKPDQDLGAWLLRKLVEVYSTVDEHDPRSLGSPIAYYEKVLLERGMVLSTQAKQVRDEGEDSGDGGEDDD